MEALICLQLAGQKSSRQKLNEMLQLCVALSPYFPHTNPHSKRVVQTPKENNKHPHPPYAGSLMTSHQMSFSFYKRAKNKKKQKQNIRQDMPTLQGNSSNNKRR